MHYLAQVRPDDWGSNDYHCQHRWHRPLCHVESYLSILFLWSDCHWEASHSMSLRHLSLFIVGKLGLIERWTMGRSFSLVIVHPDELLAHFWRPGRQSASAFPKEAKWFALSKFATTCLVWRPNECTSGATSWDSSSKIARVRNIGQHVLLELSHRQWSGLERFKTSRITTLATTWTMEIIEHVGERVRHLLFGIHFMDFIWGLAARSQHHDSQRNRHGFIHHSNGDA